MGFRDEINRHLYSLSLELDPTDDADEERRRHDILVDAGHRALAAAAELPGGDRSAARKRAILAAMMIYGRARLAGEAAEFHVERSSNGKLASAPSWMIAMVEKVTQDLIRQDWDKAPEREAAGHFVSKKGRYGEVQKKGTQRRFDTENKRIAAIQAAARAMATEGFALIPDYEVPESKARDWIRRYKKPSQVADALIAHYVNEIARNRDGIIERYNSNVDESVERRNREVDEPQRQGLEQLKIDPSAKTELKPNLTRRWVKSKAQQGREKLVHLRRQHEGLKLRQISQAPPVTRDDPEAE